MPEKSDTHSTLSLSALLEALLFSAPGPVTAAHLATALEITPGQVETGLEELESYYADRGLRIQRHRGRYQLTTAPDLGHLIEAFLGLEATRRLSRAALEALAIIAYQQPVTRPQVDAIRGVNSDSVIKNLLTIGLVQELGRAEGPGRPILYGTTTEFLQHFGVDKLEDLPPIALEEFENGASGEGAGESEPDEKGRILKG